MTAAHCPTCVCDRPRSVHHTSKSQEWRTPIDLFLALDREFGFNLDAAASVENHLCEMYWTKHFDGLQQEWAPYSPIYCNPPYATVGKWIAKAAEEADKGATVVMLIAARPDTRAWQQHIIGRPNVEVRFLPGRVKFIGESGQGQSAPFPSAVCIFRPPTAEAQP